MTLIGAGGGACGPSCGGSGSDGRAASIGRTITNAVKRGWFYGSKWSANLIRSGPACAVLGIKRNTRLQVVDLGPLASPFNKTTNHLADLLSSNTATGHPRPMATSPRKNFVYRL